MDYVAWDVRLVRPMEFPSKQLIGEFLVHIDKKGRVVLPATLAEIFCAKSKVKGAILSKERPGVLSLWHPDVVEKHISPLEDEIWKLANEPLPPMLFVQLQQFARLLSARRLKVNIESNGRFRIPLASRDFAGIKPEHTCIIVGAGSCIEIWNEEIWSQFIEQEITWFSHTFEKLLGWNQQERTQGR